MKKLMISLSNRQDTILRSLSGEQGLPLSELIRRALDNFIDKMVKDGTLVRFTFSATDKSMNLEMPKDKFKEFFDLVKANPGCFTFKEEP